MSHDKEPLPLEIAKLIDQRCDAYEADSMEGQPSIEDYLQGFPERWVVALLENLVSLDIEIRLKRGERVSIEQYHSRFPQLNVNPGSWDKTRTVAQYCRTDSTVGFNRLRSSIDNDRLHYFGDYELLEVCGRGGMGTVFRARQVTLDRIVAVKMLNEGLVESSEAVTRFQVEASAAAQLDHPNIVPVYEVGQQDGRHFFSMAYVHGESLAERLREGPLEPKQAANQMVLICRAVHFAHQNGIVHRDLKPSNILLDQLGTPKVSDFGLAKFVSEATGLTVTGEVLGTPCYMSPEQASGQVKEQNHLADVYSLGAILYCCLSGRPPFQAASSVATMKQVIEADAVALRVLNTSVPRDLETIAHRCLEKEPHLRYTSALAVAEDLRRYLDGRPILARPISFPNKVYRWARRNPAHAANFSILLCVAFGAALVWTWISNREKRIAAIAESRSVVHDLVVTRFEDIPSQVEFVKGRLNKDPHLPKILVEQWKELEATGDLSLGLAVVLRDQQAEALDRVCEIWLDCPWSLWPWIKQHLPRNSANPIDWIASRQLGELENLSPNQIAKLVVLKDWCSPGIRSSTTASALDEVLKAWVSDGKMLKAIVEEFARDPDQREGIIDACEPFELELTQQLVLSLDYRQKYLSVFGPVEARLLQGLWRNKVERWIEYGGFVHRDLLHVALDLNIDDAARATLLAHLDQPMPNEATWDQRQRWRRCKAIVATVLMANGEPLWHLLEFDRDPSVAAMIVEFLPRIDKSRAKIDQQLILHLKQRPNTALQPAKNVSTPAQTALLPNPWLADPFSARLRNLLLMVGNYPPIEFKKLARSTIQADLLALLKTDPDPGIHAACEWLLKRAGLSVEQVEQELAIKPNHTQIADPITRPETPGQGWRVGPNHHVLIKMQGPVSFVAGAALDDPNRDGGEVLNPQTKELLSWSVDRPHQKLIPRSYEIGMHETQFGQVQAFDPKFHEICNLSLSPEFHYPACKISWNQAAKYCNWLSELSELSPNQWCFVEQDGTMVLPEDYLTRKGFRLPTEAEWEWACKAGTITSRYFGDEDELFESYVWYGKNSLELKYVPIGTMKPNGLGLFEALGNSAEWCIDSYSTRSPGARVRTNDVEQNNPKLDHRIIKGGSIWSNSNEVRVSEYSNFEPAHFEGNIGFRIARTIESFDAQDK